MTEADLQREIMKAVSAAGARIFRNNVGVGWAGQLVSNRDGIVTLARARPLHAGLCKGSSDLIGWTPTLITQDLVGERLAVFTAIEVKSKGARATDEQETFLDRVDEAGGYGDIARSVDQALAIIQGRGAL